MRDYASEGWSAKAITLLQSRPTNADDNPVSTGLPTSFLKSGDSSLSTFYSDGIPSMTVKYTQPTKFCDHCHRRKTGWVVLTKDSESNEIAHRTCPHDMTPEARRLVESIFKFNDGLLPKSGFPQRGVSR